ncbi:MAG TPA: dihydroorotate dehydrogenase electron transfer subunit [Selenomonadales bacterium]|nr:dihydroorotate dehydrogenase electron transfer subunit [Selenomonadales bacterium]
MALVRDQKTIGPLVKLLTLEAPEIAKNARPGQFVHLRVNDGPAPLLRRPLSLAGADAGQGTLTLIYRIVGQGTALLARLKTGDRVDCMGPLGAGFDLDCERPLLVGGGMGLAPLLYLAGALCPRPVAVLMGGRSQEELFWQGLFAEACRHIHITTDDGSLGRRGVTLDLLPELLAGGEFDRVAACGPRLMLEGAGRLAARHKIACQVSLEDYMACGVGACLSCTCAGADGRRRKVCADGPVFWAGEVFAL